MSAQYSAFAFLLRPKQALVLAAAERIDYQAALTSSTLLVAFVATALGVSLAAFWRDPLEGVANLGELGLGGTMCAVLLRRLRSATNSLRDAFGRLCIVLSSVVVVWFGAGVLFIVLAVAVLKLDGGKPAVVSFTNVAADVAYLGMLLHALRIVSGVTRLVDRRKAVTRQQ